MRLAKIILLLLTSISWAQEQFVITGNFERITLKEIVLKGYNGLEEYALDKTTTDAKGHFTLKYPATYQGAALIEIVQGKKLIVLLNRENFQIDGTDLNSTKNIQFTGSVENVTFDKGLSVYQNTQEKKAGISHLLPYYTNEPKKSEFFKSELVQLNEILPQFLQEIPSQSYVNHYLKLRFLIADFQISLKRYPERITELKNQFLQLDFKEPKTIHSGLFVDLIQTYIATVADQKNGILWLNEGTDAILKSLKTNPELKQNIAEYLFNVYEKKSLFEASEHLALQMLNDQNCSLDIKHKALFEQYRKMANGKTAPDIQLSVGQNLHNLKSKFKLVVFGASWCQKCTEEIPKLAQFYQNWKDQYQLEVVFVSLDTQKQEYQNFIRDFKWVSTCDFKSWESPTVTDYCVFATPTLYLLDANNNIQLKPISAEQISAWLELHQP